MKNIVTIGGGNGQPVILRALKKIKKINIKAIVTVMDSGGSSGRLCAESDILPIGDIMKCFVALSKNEKKISDFLTSRFVGENKLKGHTAGNLLLAAMIKYCGNYAEALAVFAEKTGAVGEVIPVALQKTMLVAKYQNGEVIKGEHGIDEPEKIMINNQIEKITIEPPVAANDKAILAISEADYIFLGPGDLYTSVLANLTVSGITEALVKTKAKIYYFMNLMSKKGQTNNMNAQEISSEMEKYLNRKLDGVIVNNEKLPQNILKAYQRLGEKQIEDDLPKTKKVLRFPLVYKKRIFKDKNDLLYRSMLIHDIGKVKKAIEKII